MTKARIYGVLKRSMTFFGKNIARWPPQHFMRRTQEIVIILFFTLLRKWGSTENRQYQHNANMPWGENFNLNWKTFQIHESTQNKGKKADENCSLLPWAIFVVRVWRDSRVELFKYIVNIGRNNGTWSMNISLFRILNHFRRRLCLKIKRSSLMLCKCRGWHGFNKEIKGETK